MRVKSVFLVFCCLFLFMESQATLKKGDHPKVKKTTSIAIGNEMLALNFPLADNPEMTTEAFVMKGKDHVYYVSLPFSLTSEQVNIEIVSPLNSRVRINGVDVTTSAGKYNDEEVFISVATINIADNNAVEIISESGRYNNYDILVQKGIKDIDSLIYSFKERYNIPGVSFAIANINNTAVSYQAGYGYAIKESKTRVQPNHLFRLASMSKQHTAICILKLVEEGKFGIDDYVFGKEGILKDKFPDVPARAARITVRNLLEHTSGYRTYPDYMFNIPYYGWSMEQRIEAMLKSKQPNEPGSVFAYYNTGYGILGYIVETVSGKSFETFMHELYAGAGIDDIHIGGTQAERRANEVAYYGQNNANAEGMDMVVRGPAGGIIASTDQLIKLLWALDGNPNIPDLISKETREMMFTPSKAGKSRYALGWRTNHTYFPDGFYHGGTLSGVATFWVYAQGYAIVFLCNSRSNYGQFDNELYRMARDMINEAKILNL